jgi:hypothetical protein
MFADDTATFAADQSFAACQPAHPQDPLVAPPRGPQLARPGPLIIDPDSGVNSGHSIRAIHEWVLDAHDQSP